MVPDTKVAYIGQAFANSMIADAVDFNEDIYEVSKIISFDDKVYKVNESIADEVTAVMK